MTGASGDPLEDDGAISAAMEILARETGVAPEQAARIVGIVSSFSGPMPPPKVLAAYEDCVPGSADRILRMAEQEQAFRHKTADSAITAASSAETSKRRYAFVVVLTMTSAAVACAALGEGATASVLGGGTVLGLAAAFLGVRIIDRHGRTGDEEP